MKLRKDQECSAKETTTEIERRTGGLRNQNGMSEIRKTDFEMAPERSRGGNVKSEREAKEMKDGKEAEGTCV